MTLSPLRARVIAAFLDDGYRLLLAPPEVGVVLGQGDRIVLVQDGTGEVRLPERDPEAGPADLVVVDGGPELAAQLTALAERLGSTAGGGRAPLRVHHAREGHEVWTTAEDDSRVLGLLRQAHRSTGSAPADVAARLTEEQGRLDEVVHFRRKLEGRTPIVTYALLVVIAAFFGLELLWGGSTDTLTLRRMGALDRGATLPGEWWRLLSCTVLHAGFLHVLFNGYVLYALGTSLERIVGSTRFLVLYVLSGIGGSLASIAFFGEGTSVGASGAIWGLLAAEAIIGFRPGGLIPRAAASEVQRVALVNLAINVLNSFRPSVDWAAHAGGGVAGALLLLSGVLTLGLPRLGDDRPDGAAEAMRGAAALCGLALAVSAVTGVLVGQPWRLADFGTAVRTAVIADTGFQVEVPADLRTGKTYDEEDGATVVFGALEDDPLLVEVYVSPSTRELDAAAIARELDDCEEVLKNDPPEGTKLTGEIATETTAGAAYCSASYAFGNGVVFERALGLTSRGMVRADAALRPGPHQQRLRGVSRRVVRSANASP